jgi:hypothetical protein
VLRSVEDHGCAELALIVADVVQMRVYQHDVAMMTVVRCFCSSSGSESRDGCETRCTGAGEVRAWFERLMGEPEGVGFEQGERGAVVRVWKVKRRQKRV